MSLTFDDGNADTVSAAPVMNAAGMHGTYYTNSGTIGLPGYQTRTDLSSLSAAGNEIAGHTVTHPDLTALSSDEAKRQICLDRDTLLGWGFPVQNFAYPFAATNASVDAIAQGCGYNSARNLGDIQSRFGCAGCKFAESIPPANPYELAAVDEADNTWTLADLESTVTNAQNNGGGWVILTFHHICSNNCDPLAVSPELFSQFVSWLSTQSANNTTVETVAQVIGGTTQPAVVVPPAASSATVTNPSFETINATTNLPDCWAKTGFGTNTATYDTVSPGHTGNIAARLTVSAYTDGDSKVMPILDLGSCAPSAIPGTSYQLSAWYTSTVNTQFEVYLRTTSGGWVYWDASPYFAPATAWTAASWITQPIPAGYDGIDFGLSLFSVGTLTTDDYSLTKDAAPVTTATVSPAAPNGTASWYTSQPTVTLTTPVTGLATTTQYSLDSGTTWLPYTAPVTIAAGTTTFSYRSTTATQTEATRTLPFKVDIDLPVVTASFNDTTRTFSASATDATSGVASIQYRTPGGAWTTYTTPTTIGSDSTTLEFRATDAAGNVSASVNIVEGAKTTATVSPATADGAAGWYKVRPTVTLSAGTPSAGQVTQYSFNGVTWGTYSVPIVVPDGISTLYFRTISSGVPELTQTLAFKVDSTPPVVTPKFTTGTRTISATATDATSGIASIQYRTPGGAWTTYTAPTTIGNDSTPREFRATDVAGNVSVSVTIIPGAKTTATVSPAVADGLAGWYVTLPKVTLSAGTPPAGQVTQYSFNGTTWGTYSAPIVVPAGISTLYFRTVSSGVPEPTQTRVFSVDNKRPVVVPKFNAATRTISATATDVGSGVARIQQSISGGPWTTYTGPTLTSSTAKSLSFRATDIAGNVSLSVPLAIAFGNPTYPDSLVRYIDSVYRDVLGRNASAREYPGWVKQILNGMPRAKVGVGFVTSTEYRNLMTIAAYKAVLGRTPSTAEVAGWVTAMKKGYTTPDGIWVIFLSTKEFYNDSGATNAGYVNGVFKKIVGRAATAAEQASWSKVIVAKGSKAFVNAIFTSREAERVQVNAAFKKFLGRAASTNDQNIWATYVHTHGLLSLRVQILGSTEYWNRAQKTPVPTN